MSYIHNNITLAYLSSKKRKIAQTISLFLSFYIEPGQNLAPIFFYVFDNRMCFFTETKNHAANGQRMPAISHKPSELINTPKTPDIPQRLIKIFVHSACEMPAAKTR